MNYLKKGLIILTGTLLISCKKENYVLYSVDNACDSVLIRQTGFNKYQVIAKERTMDGRIIKDQDSLRIMKLDMGPNVKLNKLILKKEYAYYPGMTYIIRKPDEKDFSLSDSKWRLLKHCGSNMERIEEFTFNRKKGIFEFKFGDSLAFTYTTKDSLHYKLYLKTVKPQDSLPRPKLTFDRNFVSAEIQLIASNIVRAKFYGTKLKDSTWTTNFDRNDQPQNVYFYKFEK